MNFRSIASSSAGNAYLLSCDGQPGLLIECGIPWAKIREALSFSTLDLAAILLSHSHSDHSKAVLDAARSGLDIYVSPGEFEALRVPDALRRRFRNVVGEPFMIGDWKVGAFHVEHDTPEPVGFVVQAADGDKLVYLSDCGSCDIEFSGLTHIAVECNHDGETLSGSDVDPSVKKRVAAYHMSLTACLDFLRVQKLDTVREIHLLHLSERNSDAARYRDAVQKATGRPTFVADVQTTAPVSAPAGAAVGMEELLDGEVLTVSNRRSASGSSVLQLTMDGGGVAVFVPDARMHGYLVGSKGKVCVLRVRHDTTKSGVPCATVVELLRVGELWFRDGQPTTVSGVPGMPWPEDEIPF